MCSHPAASTLPLPRRSALPLLGLFLVWGGCPGADGAGPSPRSLGVKLKLSGALALARQREEGGKRQLYYRSDRDHLLIDVIPRQTPAMAADLIKSNRFLIQSLYEPYFSPYPGRVTHKRTCMERFKPRPQERRTGADRLFAFRLYSNARLAYGGCTEDVNQHAAVLAFLYCGASRTLFKVSFHTPASAPSPDLEGFVSALACAR